MSSVIETIDLARRFRGLDAVDALNLQVPAGSIFALVGPNGAGKTTTIKLLMNLVRPTRGRAFVLGADSRRLGPPQFRRIGYVSENQRLPGWMTPEQLFAYLRPFYPTWDDALSGKLQVDLGLREQTPLRALSRGTRMKAALLASVAYHPELVVLDEPFTGLDPVMRDELIRALLELANAQPCTVFLSSHDIEELERLADWIGFIDRGRLVLAERVSSVSSRFRFIEVVVPDGVPLHAPDQQNWLAQGVTGRTVRFVDTDHGAPGAMSRIMSAYPGAHVSALPLSLRDIFLVLARRSASVRAPTVDPS